MYINPIGFHGPLNFFRLTADCFHLLSFYFLFRKLRVSRKVEGLSRKTQELLLAVFCTRYLDVLSLLWVPTNWSLLLVYNTSMKIFFILACGSILWHFTRTPWKATYDANQDSFRHLLFLVLPCALLAVALRWQTYSMTEILYAFSILLESVAIFPQLILLQRHKNIEGITANYVMSLGVYRGFYILNWIYRYSVDGHTTETIVWVGGVVQTLLYADFFYHYYQAVKKNRALVLPS